MRVTLNTKSLETKLMNATKYSFGFIEGIQKGKTKFLHNLGISTMEIMYQYIDSEARANPESLHHVYEWYKTGSPEARLFDLDMTVSNLGLSIRSKFKQSNSVQIDSNTPFYNKAYIMENGIPVIIRPKKNVLVFKSGGETVFTKSPVSVDNPGGTEVQGSYERIFDQFMLTYFTQAFFHASGLSQYISKPTVYKRDFPSGSKGGKAVGVKTGYRWIINAKVGM